MLTVICAVKGGLRQTGAPYHSAAYPKGKPDGECSMPLFQTGRGFS